MLVKKCGFNIERAVTLQSNDSLDVTVLIAGLNSCHAWLLRDRRAKQSSWASSTSDFSFRMKWMSSAYQFQHQAKAFDGL